MGLDGLDADGSEYSEVNESLADSYINARQMLSSYTLEESMLALATPEVCLTSEELEISNVSKINKYVRSKMFTPAEVKQGLYNWSSIPVNNGNTLVSSYKGKFKLLDLLNNINLERGKKRFLYTNIDSNVSTMVNLFQLNNTPASDEPILFLYIGRDFKKGIVIKNNEFLKSFSLVIPDTNPMSMRQAIFSKLTLAQDTGSIPYTKHIVLAGEYVDEEDIEFFQAQALGEEVFSRIKIPSEFVNKKHPDELAAEKEMAAYAIPIALAWKSLEPKNADFVQSTMLPQYIIERQKSFKLAWHGWIMLIIMMGLAYLGTIEYLTINRKIERLEEKIVLTQTEVDTKVKPVRSYDQEKAEITALENTRLLVGDIIGNKNQWHVIIKKIADFAANNKLTWYTSVVGKADNFLITGYTTKRKIINRLSALFGDVKIKTVENTSLEGVPIWKFEMSFSYPQPRDWKAEWQASKATRDKKRLAEHAKQAKADKLASEKAIAQARQKEIAVAQAKQTAAAKAETARLVEKKQLATLAKKKAAEEAKLSKQKQVKAKERAASTVTSNATAKVMFNDAYYDYFGKNKFAEAALVYEQIITKFTGQKHAYLARYMLGETYFHRGLMTKARATFKILRAETTLKWPESLLMTANSYIRQDDEINAMLWWQKLIETHPKHKLTKIAKRKLRNVKARRTKNANQTGQGE